MYLPEIEENHHVSLVHGRLLGQDYSIWNHNPSPRSMDTTCTGVISYQYLGESFYNSDSYVTHSLKESQICDGDFEGGIVDYHFINKISRFIV